MARRIAIELFLMVAAGVLLGLIGPFGSYLMPPGERVAMWVLMIVSGYPIFRGLGGVSRWLAEETPVPPLLATLLALAVAALPMTLVVALLWFRIAPADAIRSDAVRILYLQVLVVGGIVHGAMALLFRDKPDPVAAVAPVEAPVAAGPPTGEVPQLPLPPGFGPVLALGAEDHYVRAIGAHREELMLLRLRDAIALLPAGAGLQVHRSWWVAHDAVRTVRRDGRTAVVTLTSGHEVPVARDAMAAVRAAGWLDRPA